MASSIATKFNSLSNPSGHLEDSTHCNFKGGAVDNIFPAIQGTWAPLEDDAEANPMASSNKDSHSIEIIGRKIGGTGYGLAGK